MRTEEEIDKLYLKSLEDRLKSLNDPNISKAKPKAFLSDLAQARDHNLFGLLTSDSVSVVEGRAVEKPWIQRKIAPQTCEINTLEKKKLLKNDQLEFKSVDFTAIGAVIEREVSAEKNQVDSEEIVKPEEIASVRDLKIE
ncbi:unnamed protein product [Bursaphelenchus xylophilus]|uniref:(pine wood nematode) hypothetical protein n=1 Tax=Bursaphelenchus xylophilus TaxID=6326 RepID=A0A1I7RHY9_BURXY|nr:unnamed protein product [Bursaphelenchus xylophilus]CAG9115279.1 unnamed protein product [Bursaphelenchus xylophilus]